MEAAVQDVSLQTLTFVPTRKRHRSSGALPHRCWGVWSLSESQQTPQLVGAITRDHLASGHAPQAIPDFVIRAARAGRLAAPSCTPRVHLKGNWGREAVRC